jgi:hypothetical protein
VLVAGFLGFLVLRRLSAATGLQLRLRGLPDGGAVQHGHVVVQPRHPHLPNDAGLLRLCRGAFAVIAALSYYHGKFADGVKTKREQRVALRQIGQIRLMDDATFEHSPVERSAQ